MVMKKTLIFSLIASFLLLGTINIANLDRWEALSVNQAGLGITTTANQEIVSFAFGNFIVYLVITGMIYLFLRGILKSFDGTSMRR